MNGRARLLSILLLIILAPCEQLVAGEISQELAIEIARQEVKFEPQSVEVVCVKEDGRPAWRVTLRGKPGPPPLVPIMIVTIDRVTGNIISLARS